MVRWKLTSTLEGWTLLRIGRFAIMRPADPPRCESLGVPGLLGQLPGAARSSPLHSPHLQMAAAGGFASTPFTIGIVVTTPTARSAHPAAFR
jgi:hypothetical protein